MGNLTAAMKRFVTVNDSISNQNRVKLAKLQSPAWQGVKAAKKAYESTGSLMTALKKFDNIDSAVAAKNRNILEGLFSSMFSSHHPLIQGFEAAKKELAK